MLEIVNQMYVEGKIADKQKHGMIVCIPKKPKLTHPEDYRPLTLLNADYKMMSRILAYRLSPWLTTLHPSQHCGIRGHTVFEALATVRDAIANAEYSRSKLCLLSLDFKEAFDNISHSYLFNILKTYGLSAVPATHPRYVQERYVVY